MLVSTRRSTVSSHPFLQEFPAFAVENDASSKCPSAGRPSDDEEDEKSASEANDEDKHVAGHPTPLL
jgi:hypothetical protein